MDWRLTDEFAYLIVPTTKWSITLVADSVQINSNLGTSSFDNLFKLVSPNYREGTQSLR